jgi:UDP-N-acetylmuramate dehydrogenase
VELKDALEEVEAYKIETGEKRIFSKDECKFGYRDSIFKRELKGKYFISAIILKLNKNPNPDISYKFLKDYLEKNNLDDKNIKNISNAVSEIRRSKLPDPKIIGNAGSFFKNVFVPTEKLKDLLKKFPDMPCFEEDNKVKIPSGWLIEQCGWKGKRVGNIGVHEKQALVLVNYGGATGEEIKNLAFQIIDSVYQKFGLTLTPEVNLI